VRTAAEEPVRPDEARNSALLTIDGVCWWVGTAFTDTATVVPAFVSLLGGSPAMIGFLTGFRAGGYFLPQLVVAHYVERWKRKKPIVVISSLLQRLALLAAAWLAYRYAASSPSLALSGFVFLYILACLSEGVTAVPWTDVLARSVHPLRRGSLYGRMQFWGGLLAFGAGFVVHRILGSPRFPYPSNFALLLALTAAAYFASFFAFLLVREPPGPVGGGRRSLGAFFGSLPELWQASPHFARLARCRVLAGLNFLALPFYVLYARDVLGAGTAAVGAYLACQMAGSVGGGLLWGRLGDRLGHRQVVRLAVLCALASPCVALATDLAHRIFPSLPAAVALGPAFFFLGLTSSGTWIGFTNYLLDTVPVARRPSYLGFMNTLVAPTTLSSVAGGLVVDRLGYPALFALCAGILALAVRLSLGLREPREMCAAEGPLPGGSEQAASSEGSDRHVLATRSVNLPRVPRTRPRQLAGKPRTPGRGAQTLR